MQKKIVVAMSGGVDSSVVAALLKSQGYEVIGVTLQLYDHGLALQRKGACCAGQDIYDAQMAAEKIGIPHYVLDYESIFKQEVMEDFADEYIRGNTPIPCVRCNQSVKFRDLYKVAKDLGADALATGHYVRKEIIDGKSVMLRGKDPKKDQSYFLFATTQEQLDYLMFPLGDQDKSITRQMAKDFGLDIADKPDSQDICFVPNGDYASVVERLRPGALDPGEIILHPFDKVLGTHNGIINFTVGQRKGIGVSYPEPLYVIKIDAESKKVYVGEKEYLLSNDVFVQDMNWLGVEIPEEGIVCSVKLRSAHAGLPATILPASGKRALVKLHEPYQGVTPGQACVAYLGDRLLGGGWIVRESIWLTAEDQAIEKAQKELASA
jgi:tRNA-specific 2-thiouridylase